MCYSLKRTVITVAIGWSQNPPSPPSAVTAEASSNEDSSWMQEGAAVTRRPTIIQSLDWNRNKKGIESGEHGPLTSFMTGIINGLDEKARLPPEELVEPALVAFRSYLRRYSITGAVHGLVGRWPFGSLKCVRAFHVPRFVSSSFHSTCSRGNLFCWADPSNGAMELQPAN
jgi:hypothetical protein